ncbi:hypothetical protein X762_03990 [Mesorhizobium sp. LSHC426A00]|nr:hypothetical protein X762_03990 [Mesorhizobium sp. LSHC426A00]ESX67982.1 hypothetical protein X758_22615 [Mesorhizobium sp. LSHC416B00]
MDFLTRFLADTSNNTARFWLTLSVSAAPHLPAGILSPYRDGERGSHPWFRQSPQLQEGVAIGPRTLLPVSIRGEGAGRRMRGGATVWAAEGHS